MGVPVSSKLKKGDLVELLKNYLEGDEGSSVKKEEADDDEVKEEPSEEEGKEKEKDEFDWSSQ